MKSVWDDHDRHEVYDEAGTITGYAPEVDYISWPEPLKRQPPDWHSNLQDQILRTVLEETYRALENDALILAGIGIRTAFDRTSEICGIKSSLPFGRKVDELKNNGAIGSHESVALKVLIDAGGAAAHRGWRPNFEEVSKLLDILENYIHRSIILNKYSAQIKSVIPPKP